MRSRSPDDGGRRVIRIQDTVRSARGSATTSSRVTSPATRLRVCKVNPGCSEVVLELISGGRDATLVRPFVASVLSALEASAERTSRHSADALRREERGELVLDVPNDEAVRVLRRHGPCPAVPSRRRLVSTCLRITRRLSPAPMSLSGDAPNRTFVAIVTRRRPPASGRACSPTSPSFPVASCS